MSRKLTKHLLILADNDDFQTSLHILLTSHPSKLNLNKRTPSGDYLVTLSAYAACERGTDVQNRLFALKCLKYTLDRDFTAVNKIAGDGGSALHSALAAASCFDEVNNNEYGDVDSHSDSDSDSDNEDSDDEKEEEEESDEEEGRDKEYLSELKSQVANDVSILDNYYPEVANLSSDAITVQTILLLLSNEADTNLPLANIHNINDVPIDNESDEIELAYARDAIMQQWTPLMFALQMVILASKRVDKYEDGSLAVSILIIHLLLKAGADPSYMMASKLDGDWNAFHILATASHILSKVNLDSNIVGRINTLHCSLQHSESLYQETYAEAIDVGEAKTVYNFLQYNIGKELNNDNDRLSSVQSFTAAIMTNDLDAALSVLENDSDREGVEVTELVRKWRSLKYSTLFPLLQSVWDREAFSSKTIMNIASFCNAEDSLNLLIVNDLPILSEEDIRNNIQSVFLSYKEDDSNIDLSPTQISCLFILLGMDNNNNNNVTIDESFCKKRQRILDRLLMESCSKVSWAQHIPNVSLDLLQLGADPNICSVANEIQDSLSPLHLIAGNHRGLYGVEKVDHLLGKKANIGCSRTSKSIDKANLFAQTSEINDLPLHFALRMKNFHVASNLYQAMHQDDKAKTKLLMRWDIEMATLLGEAAIECNSIDLFQSAIDLLKECFSDDQQEVDHIILGKAIGKLFLWAFDERSGFGSNKHSSNCDKDECPELKRIVEIISQIQDEIQEINISAWARDEISGHTPLHLMLRNDRGNMLRNSLLGPLCAIMSNDCLRKGVSSSYFVSLACSEKFGLYTPLHLACALGCEDSVKILLESNADPTVLSGDKKKPMNMIPNGSCFSKEVENCLQ